MRVPDTTAIQDAYPVVDLLPLVKIALALPPDDTAQDAYLEMLIAASLADADWYCENDFDGNSPPASVKRWVVQDVVSQYENPDIAVQARGENGIGSVTLDRSELTRFSGLHGATLRVPIRGAGYGTPGFLIL